MKITRKLLLGIVAGMGIFIIAYSVFRHFTGIGFEADFEKKMIDFIVFAALAVFVYNRKLASDERKEREAKEKAKAAEEAEKAEAVETDAEAKNEGEAGGS
jgi:ABC-type lipoprotein release transport system permease subunit